MLRFISFGSGSSGNCYFLFSDSDGLVIDSGVGIRQLKKHFRDFGLSLSHVRHILVTHDHADHVKSVGSLSIDLQVPVHTTQDVHVGIFRNYCVSKKIPTDLQRSVEKGKEYVLGDFKVTPFSVPHDSTDCVGYKIEAEGVVFSIMTDVGCVTDEMKQIIGEANYLVIEANHDEEMLKSGPYPSYLKKRIMSTNGHLSNTDCAQAIAENITEKIRHIWLCHLSEENNHPELARKTITSVLASYGIIAGKDLQLDILKRKTPTGIFELSPVRNEDE